MATRVMRSTQDANTRITILEIKVAVVDRNAAWQRVTLTKDKSGGYSCRYQFEENLITAGTATNLILSVQ
jgi:hypothetical protein